MALEGDRTSREGVGVWDAEEVNQLPSSKDPEAQERQHFRQYCTELVHPWVCDSLLGSLSSCLGVAVCAGLGVYPREAKTRVHAETDSRLFTLA